MPGHRTHKSTVCAGALAGGKDVEGLQLALVLPELSRETLPGAAGGETEDLGPVLGDEDATVARRYGVLPEAL